MLKMSRQDEALLREVLRIVSNPPALGYTQKVKNDETIRQFADLLDKSSAYSQEKREQAQAIVEAKRKIDPKYARSKKKTTI